MTPTKLVRKRHCPSPATPQKVKIAHKLRETKTLAEIAAIMDYSKSWVGKVLKNYSKATGLPLVEQKQRGRKPHISDNYNDAIDALVKFTEFRSFTSKEVADVFRTQNLFDVTERTMRRRLVDLGFRKTRPVKNVLTRLHKLTRVEWCREIQDQLLENPDFFDTWLISDEVRFSLDGKCVPQIYIAKGENRYDEHLQIDAATVRGSVMFWGVVSRNGPVCLVRVTGIVEKLEIWGKIKTMDQHRYLDLLSAYLLPYLEEHPEATFQQDGASIHTSKIMMEFFKEFGCTPPFWPPKSPDLSVIENVWGLIKHALGKIKILTVTDFEYWVPKLWDELVTPELCRSLYDSIPSRIEAVMWNNGARTKY